MSNEIVKSKEIAAGDGDLKMPTPKTVESHRAIAEVQAAVISAKNYPRDVSAAYTRIIESCKRKRIAEQAVYTYKRGGVMVEGPSIRLAEVLAQNYGNLSFGTIELARHEGYSEMMSFCHDMETNVRQTRIFQVPHTRSSREKGVTQLTDSRDIYEMNANLGARRLRACILGIIPADIVEDALEQCDRTLKEDGKNEPIQDRVNKMVVAFQTLGVNQEMIEQRLQHKVTAINEAELVGLRKIFTSIKEGVASREDFFKFKTEEKESDLNARFE